MKRAVEEDILAVEPRVTKKRKVGEERLYSLIINYTDQERLEGEGGLYVLTLESNDKRVIQNINSLIDESHRIDGTMGDSGECAELLFDSLYRHRTKRRATKLFDNIKEDMLEHEEYEAFFLEAPMQKLFECDSKAKIISRGHTEGSRYTHSAIRELHNRSKVCGYCYVDGTD